MSDGCNEEGRSTCTGCPKAMKCERGGINEEILALMKLKEHYPKKYRKKVKKRKRKSAARLKVKR